VGASTITMQTAKNLLLWPGRDPVRKALEAWLTPQLALLWPKRRILEVYLNVAGRQMYADPRPEQRIPAGEASTSKTKFGCAAAIAVSSS